AEIADLLAQRQDLVDHLVDAAVDDTVIHDVVVGDLFVGLLLVGLEHVEPVAALHLGAHLLVIEPIRTLLVVAAVARRRLVVVQPGLPPPPPANPRRSPPRPPRPCLCSNSASATSSAWTRESWPTADGSRAFPSARRRARTAPPPCPRSPAAVSGRAWP